MAAYSLSQARTGLQNAIAERDRYKSPKRRAEAQKNVTYWQRIETTALMRGVPSVREGQRAHKDLHYIDVSKMSESERAMVLTRLTKRKGTIRTRLIYTDGTGTVSTTAKRIKEFPSGDRAALLAAKDRYNGVEMNPATLQYIVWEKTTGEPT